MGVWGISPKSLVEKSQDAFARRNVLWSMETKLLDSADSLAKLVIKAGGLVFPAKVETGAGVYSNPGMGIDQLAALIGATIALLNGNDPGTAADAGWRFAEEFVERQP